MSTPPTIDGVAPSRFQLVPGPWATVMEALCDRFPSVGRERWRARFERGRVLDGDGRPLPVDAPFRLGAEVRYYREVDAEARLPFEETIVHVDEHLLVVDKPHFLPVVPAGGFVAETLLARLVRRFGNADLVPLHRIDRLTSGLVLFSTNPDTRSRYQALFRERMIIKRYEALAPPLPGLAFPAIHRSRLVRGEPFFRMREAEGEPNSLTRIEVVEQGAALWRYALEPVTGRKHQLRVHMAALGAPIHGDPLYPDCAAAPPIDDHSRPMQLLARFLAFADPVDGRPRSFESGLRLMDV